MSLFDTIERSKGNIDSLAGLVQQHYRKQREQENEQKMMQLMQRRTSDGSPWNMSNASMDDILNMGQTLRETPGLQGEFNLMNQAAEARKPKTMIEKLQHSIVPVTVDPSGKASVGKELYHEPAAAGLQAKPQWLNRNGKLVYDLYQEGDQKYEKPGKETEWDSLMKMSGGDPMKALQLKATGSAKPKKKSAVITNLETDKASKEKYVRTKYPDVDLKAALQGTYPVPPKGKNAEEILTKIQNGERVDDEDKAYADKVKAVDAYVRSHEKLYARYDQEGIEYQDPMGGGAAPATAAPAGPRKLDADTAKQYLQKAGGDKGKARQLAKADGYSF